MLAKQIALHCRFHDCSVHAFHRHLSMHETFTAMAVSAALQNPPSWIGSYDLQKRPYRGMNVQLAAAEVTKLPGVVKITSPIAWKPCVVKQAPIVGLQFRVDLI